MGAQFISSFFLLQADLQGTSLYMYLCVYWQVFMQDRFLEEELEMVKSKSVYNKNFHRSKFYAFIFSLKKPVPIYILNTVHEKAFTHILANTRYFQVLLIFAQGVGHK